MNKRPMTLNRLHAYKHDSPALRRWFANATSEEVEAVTVPCPGEAHGNPHIDHCMVCLGLRWGRVLKPLSKENDKA
jgi:hypothetical protein